MIDKTVDINHIFEEDEIKLLKDMGWNRSIAVQYHNEYDKEKFDKAKEYGEKHSLEIYCGIKIKTNSSKDLTKAIKRFRNKADVLLVEGGIVKINRKALESHEVDILSTPELNRNDNGIDHILARLGSTHRVAIELNLNSLLEKKYYERARLLWSFRRNIFLARKYDTPVVISSGAKDIYGIKSPNDLRSFLNTLIDPIYSKKIMETTNKILDYRIYLKKNNVVRYGIEIVKEE